MDGTCAAYVLNVKRNEASQTIRLHYTTRASAMWSHNDRGDYLLSETNKEIAPAAAATSISVSPWFRAWMDLRIGLIYDWRLMPYEPVINPTERPARSLRSEQGK